MFIALLSQNQSRFLVGVALVRASPTLTPSEATGKEWRATQWEQHRIGHATFEKAGWSHTSRAGVIPRPPID